MADVQLEDGYTRLANSLLEAIAGSPMPGVHKDVLLAVIRLTYGFNKAEDRLAVGQIIRIVQRDGRAVDRAIRDLERWNVLTITRPVGVRGLNTFRVQKDFDAWTIGRTENADMKAAASAHTRRTHPGAGTPVHAPPPGAGTGVHAPPPPGAGTPSHPGAGAPLQRQKDTSSKDRRTLPSGEAPDGAALATSGDPARWVHVLGREPGGFEEKLAWVERELPLLEAKAIAEHPGETKDARKQRNARIRSLVITHWRNRHLYPQDRDPPGARQKPTTFHAQSVENTKEAAQGALRLVLAREGLDAESAAAISAGGSSASDHVHHPALPGPRDRG